MAAEKKPGPAALQLQKWLDGANDNTRTLSRAWQVVRAWKAGELPKTPDELMNWALVLSRGKRRAKTQVKALDGLLDILAAKMADPAAGGMSLAEVGRIIDVSKSQAEIHVRRGRATLEAIGKEATGAAPEADRP